MIVFDGYPPSGYSPIAGAHADIIFAKNKSADERIKMMVENSVNRKNIFVVSDDKEIRFVITSCGAKSLTVEKFINLEKDAKKKSRDDDSSELKLKLSQMEQINKELRRIWLE